MDEEKKLDDKALENVSGGSTVATMEDYRAYVEANCTDCGFMKRRGRCFHGDDGDRYSAFFCGRNFNRNAPCPYKNW